ncbi:MAG: dipeptide epimerase [Verrucomicrobiota bacterium]|nr:dipeptide epimerase [Verrucomicrobiota bacterium]
MELHLHEYELPLKHPFKISRGTVTVQQSLIVELRQDGLSGYGEAVSSTYYNSPIDTMRKHLEGIEPLLAGETFRDTNSFWNLCAERLAKAPFVLSALDCAAHDLWGQLEDSPVHRLWGLDPDDSVASSFTIGIAEVDEMVAKLAEMPGWPVYKIKLGTRRDIEIIRALRGQTDAVFRIDANCGWTPDEAAALTAEMAQLGVEFIEQPLDPTEQKAQESLFHKSALPIIADENCVGEADVSQCADRFHGINIKLCKCGGLTPARRMITTARDHGLKVMVGCMAESSVGISAAAQLAPLLDYADLDGAVLLAKDAADGVQLRQGQLTFPNAPGLGIRSLK